ncbi:hypothetical protein N799_05750 [Lysobacter arseniciresistens ZS79]|uniref:Phosphatidic acid phosphatase type 2/haloperoxidase domain-containing protein n=2 Tax=Novilysobacter TaxID=3382699 RepID=A0A0A0F4U9_9GAMM|nr:hypothetical protein N799_05750 [Lysobacter arseniciresistens ZS79]
MGSKDVALWVWPLAALALLSVWLLGLRGDLWLADWLYAWEGGRWALQSHWLTGPVLHTGARHASTAAWVGVVLAWLASLLHPGWHAWRRPLGYLALAVLLGTGLVSALKAHSQMDCPWDLARYGGTRAYHRPWQAAGQTPGRCFPAGHASAGYAWLALYFFFDAVRPRWRRRGLAAGLGLGLLFGIDQQLRGAHFLSHDLYSAAICWFIALGLSRWVLRSRRAEMLA